MAGLEGHLKDSKWPYQCSGCDIGKSEGDISTLAERQSRHRKAGNLPESLLGRGQQKRHGVRIIAGAEEGRRRSHSPIAAVARTAVFLSTVLACLVAPAEGLVIEEPFHGTFDHVAAAFGPDLLNVEPPVESRPLVRARPRDGCAPLQNSLDYGAIALVERGACNFTQKVLHAQEAGASAVVVTDTRPTDKWLMVMYGNPENAQGIEIPAVLVSYATGELLWSNRSWMPGRPARLLASVGATGHIVLAPRPVGALEMLGIYLLLSVLLLAFSGVCGLLFALAFTWYRRGYRTRAMRKLKSFTFRRLAYPYVSASASKVDADQTSESSSSSSGGGGGGGGESGAAAGQRGSAAAATAAAVPDRGHLPSLGAGDKEPAGSPNRRRHRTCGVETCENCGGGGGGAGAGAGIVDGAGYSNSADASSAVSGGGGVFMEAEDDLCAICLETYEDGESLTGLPCRHSFHTECIQPWLSGKSALCPMCKREAFGKGGLFMATAPQLEAAFAELAAHCTENLAVLGLFFLASVVSGVVAAKLSLRD